MYWRRLSKERKAESTPNYQVPIPKSVPWELGGGKLGVDAFFCTVPGRESLSTPNIQLPTPKTPN